MTAASESEEEGIQAGFVLRGLEMTRLETFTDAAFAFALTLLVISLEPPTSMDGLQAALREIPAFVVSGALLMMFWWGHREWSRRYGLDDGATIVLSCVLVFTVMIYVIPLRFMFDRFFGWIGFLSGIPIGSATVEFEGMREVRTMFIVYGIGFSCMAGSLVLLYLYAWHRRVKLALSDWEVFETVSEAGVWGIVAATGVLSVLVALFTEPSSLGSPGWVYMLLPFTTIGFGYLRDRRRDGRPWVTGAD